MNNTAPLPHTRFAPYREEVCSEDDVKHLVHTFYAAARDDAMLGPIFAAEVKDWDAHLATLVDFWSGLLRGTMRYHGKPLAQQEKADTIALNIAERLWKSFAESHAIVAPQL